MIGFLRDVFSVRGMMIAVYFLIGVFLNTAAPHLPTHAPASVAGLHSWVQWIFSVLFWPLGLWKPELTLGKWTP